MADIPNRPRPRSQPPEEPPAAGALRHDWLFEMAQRLQTIADLGIQNSDQEREAHYAQWLSRFLNPHRHSRPCCCGDSS